MKNDLIPTRYTRFIALENNFIKKYKSYAKRLGIDDEEVNQTIEIFTEHTESHADMISKRGQSRAATEKHTIKKKASIKEFRRVAKLLKSSKGYDSSIGEDLMILATDPGENSSAEIKPKLSTNITGSTVNIKFVKQRRDGIKVFSRRGDEKEFTLLGYTAISPYKDTRDKLDPKKPETRDYYAFFVKNFTAIGVKSDTFSVTVP